MMRGSNPDTKKLAELYIPADSIGAEIGVWRGESSKHFLTKAKFLYMIDPWSLDVYDENNTGWVGRRTLSDLLHYLKPMIKSSKPEDAQKYYEEVYNKVCEEFLDKPVKIFRGTSDKWFEGFNDHLDWIYIDGDHTYDAVYRDLENSLKVVDKIIFCDDYNIIAHNDVRMAIQDFCLDNMLKPEPLLNNQCMIRL